MTPRISSSDVTMSDYYCGAGGSSTGAVATGAVRVVMAVNHWDLAIRTHNTNHPGTDHDKADINKADPRRYPRTTIGWFSPECTYWSQARGEKLPDGQLAWDFFGDQLPDEAAERSRMGMWDVPRFAAHHLYDIVIVENVPRVVKGAHWPSWLKSMHDLGYLHEVLWLNSMHAQGMGAGAPQSRDRVYIVFWRAGNPRPDFDKWLRPLAHCPVHGLVQSVQVFKPSGSVMKTYGAQYTLRCPHADCHHAEVFPDVAGADTIIDWDLRGIRIGDRETLGMDALAEKTMQRIAAGARRYWMPLVVEAAGNTYDATSPRHPQYGDLDAYHRAWPADEPLRTLHATASKALVVNNVSGSDESRTKPATDPLPALVAGGTRTGSETDALVVPLRNHGTAKPTPEPIDTVAASGNHHALVVRQQNSRGRMTGMSTPVQEPLRTLTAAGNQSLVTPGTLTHKALMDMVMDAEFRMLEPSEIKRGMAFGSEYILLGNRREQVNMAGNAVTPNAARDIIAACVESLGVEVAA